MSSASQLCRFTGVGFIFLNPLGFRLGLRVRTVRALKGPPNGLRWFAVLTLSTRNLIDVYGFRCFISVFIGSS